MRLARNTDGSVPIRASWNVVYVQPDADAARLQVGLESLHEDRHFRLSSVAQKHLLRLRRHFPSSPPSPTPSGIAVLVIDYGDIRFGIRNN